MTHDPSKSSLHKVKLATQLPPNLLEGGVDSANFRGALQVIGWDK